VIPKVPPESVERSVNTIRSPSAEMSARSFVGSIALIVARISPIDVSFRDSTGSRTAPPEVTDVSDVLTKPVPLLPDPNAAVNLALAAGSLFNA
jgi:hypothetical protein